MDFVDFIDKIFEGRIEISTQPFKTKEEALSIAEKALPTLKRILKRAATPNARVVYGIKPVQSIDNKLERWKEKGRTIETMFDVLRGTIATDTKEEMETVVDRLSRGPVIVKHEVKEKPDQYGYYGSHHIDLYIPEFKIVAEIQVMTKKLIKAKAVGHEIYSKYRSEKNPPKDILDRSKEIYHRANKPKFIVKKRPTIEPEDY
jgi:hypothetical protein